MATEHKHIRELRPRLERDGFELLRYEHTRGTHLRLYLRKDGLEFALTTALSPSTRGNHNMVLQNARHRFREKQNKNH